MNCIIIITGDIFDDNRVYGDSLIFYNRMIKCMADFYPIIIIPGNHDNS